MRLLEELPLLEYNEGSFRAHDTSGEHADKGMAQLTPYNVLRDAQLSPADSSSPQPIGSQELFDMLIDGGHEVVFVEHLHPKGQVELVAGAIAQRAEIGPFQKRIIMRELVVTPEQQRLGIASYILGRMTSLDAYGSTQPTELVLPTNLYKMPEWLPGKLQEVGFRESKTDESLILRLPGTKVEVPEGFSSRPPIPDGWNGYLESYVEPSVQSEVYRDGKLVGTVVSAERFWYDNNDQRVSDFRLLNAGGEEITQLQGLTTRQAITSLLNDFE